jgi:anti-sigma factor ChrR (cupin superfamily)
MIDEPEIEAFDDATALVLARFTDFGTTRPAAEVRQRLMTHLFRPPVPGGFSLKMSNEQDWLPHPVPGIRMKVLSVNRTSGYATLELDVRPGTRFPAHHHAAAEECYVLSGSLYTCGRRLGPGDFVHADAGTDHAELWTEEGCRVLLVVSPDEHLGHLAT